MFCGWFTGTGEGKRVSHGARGAMNEVLLAPGWPQMKHVPVAEIFRILLVLASAEQLFAARPSGYWTTKRNNLGHASLTL
jgi:hypothetical protein